MSSRSVNEAFSYAHAAAHHLHAAGSYGSRDLILIATSKNFFSGFRGKRLQLDADDASPKDLFPY